MVWSMPSFARARPWERCRKNIRSPRARAAEQAIRDQVHDEISVAIRGVEADMRVNVDRMKSLEAQSAEIQARLERLGAVRADYANLAATAKNRLESLKTVEHDLAEARASHSRPLGQPDQPGRSARNGQSPRRPGAGIAGCGRFRRRAVARPGHPVSHRYTT